MTRMCVTERSSFSCVLFFECALEGLRDVSENTRWGLAAYIIYTRSLIGGHNPSKRP